MENQSQTKEKPKKSIWKKWWFWLIVVFVIIIITSGSGNTTTTSTNQQETSAPATEQEATPTTETENVQKQETSPNTQVTETQQEQQQPTWQIVKSWQGTGTKKTEPFEITGKQWRINWKSNGGEYGILYISVYHPGDDIIVDVAANARGNAEDTSYIYKTGTFYLDVNAANTNWSITVEELK